MNTEENVQYEQLTDRKTVTIDINEYTVLVSRSVKFDMLIDGLYGCASLSWDKKALRFDDDETVTLLKAIDSYIYNVNFHRVVGEGENGIDQG